jgi:acetylornithine aminotransferase
VITCAQELRGLGLICGVQLDVLAGPLVNAARDHDIIAMAAGKGDIVPLVPSLVVTEKHIAQCCAVLGELAKEVLVSSKP